MKNDANLYDLLAQKVYVPPTFGKNVKSASDALESAACLLEEEGRFMKSNWYLHNDTSMDEYKDDPYCNGWGSCAEGALMLVTGGMIKFCASDKLIKQREDDGFPTHKQPQWEVNFQSEVFAHQRDPEMERIYDQAYQFLLVECNLRSCLAAEDAYEAGRAKRGFKTHWETVYAYNDAHGVTREDVCQAMRQAARAARGEPRADEPSDA